MEEEEVDDVQVLEITDHIDLHGFRPNEIRYVVEDYLEAAQAKGLREVRLIHGRGKGVQRAQIQARLRSNARVERFADAPPGRGGWGATLCWLKLAATEDDDEPPVPES